MVMVGVGEQAVNGEGAKNYLELCIPSPVIKTTQTGVIAGEEGGIREWTVDRIVKYGRIISCEDTLGDKEVESLGRSSSS